jgi:hypothetical protein
MPVGAQYFKLPVDICLESGGTRAAPARRDTYGVVDAMAHVVNVG